MYKKHTVVFWLRQSQWSAITCLYVKRERQWESQRVRERVSEWVEWVERGEARWSEVKRGERRLSEVKWGEVRWSEVKGGEGRWREVKGGEVRWSEVEWGGVRWSEVEWGGVRWVRWGRWARWVSEWVSECDRDRDRDRDSDRDRDRERQERVREGDMCLFQGTTVNYIIEPRPCPSLQRRKIRKEQGSRALLKQLLQLENT